ncbi:MAG: gamma-glutamylcyclotransferase [Oscillospiraceae bacterium]|nr:gamma-glutamylcyclotransferase [Oscillospiraceae bacterium]
MTKRLYIAYGSNLNRQQMKVRCPGASVVGTAVIKDYRLLFRGSKTGAYLTIEPHKDGMVPAAVWSVTAEDERRLDRYEGAPIFYRKEEMELPVVDIRSGAVRNLSGFVYVMCDGRPLGLPSNDYFMVCAQGYRGFGFDPKILLDAYSDSRREDVLWNAIW